MQNKIYARLLFYLFLGNYISLYTKNLSFDF